jgi:hypothetical protein
VNAVSLNWKNFTVDLSRAKAPLLAILGEDYDGLVASNSFFLVCSKNPISPENVTAIETWWQNAVEADFQPTTQELISASISAASSFGNKLATDFVVENVQMGITQAGKSGAMIDYLHELVHCILSGSLHQAVSVIDGYIADSSPEKEYLQPFVSNERLIVYKHKIQDYLGVPHT